MKAFRIVLPLLLCVVSLTILAQPKLKLPHPLMGNVVENQDETLSMYIRADGAIGYARNGHLYPTGASVCVPDSVAQLGIAFDNDSGTDWRVRLRPPADTISKDCAALQCARTKQDLVAALGLCDGGGTDAQCITTDDALSRCIGPECTFLRNNCKLAGAVNDRRCEMKVSEVITACERGCDTVLELPGSETYSTNPKDPLVGDGVEFDDSIRRSNVTFVPDLLPKDKASYDFVIENNAGIETRLTVTRDGGGAACLSLIPQSTTFREVAVVPLDTVGVASWVYLNPRLPACLACDQPVPALAFENRTSDRAFTIAIDLPAEVAPAVRSCETGKPCSISRTVQPNNATIIDSSILELVPPKMLLRFRVGFYDETEKPSNAVAYLTLRQEFDEPKSELGTNIVAKVGGVIDPFVAAPPEKFVDDNGDFIDDKTGFVLCYPTTPDAYAKDAEPALCALHRLYDGDFTRHYTGLARVELSKNLGSRADFNAVVNYRTSDFGVDDGNQVKLSEYSVNIYGTNAATFRFGRTTWASPANGIAIFEKGDGFRVSYKYFTLGYLIRRESAKSLADPSNDDSRSIIGQIKAIPLSQGHTGDIRFLRGLKLLDITAVRGEDKLSHIYTTAGAEVFYTYTNLGCGDDIQNCIASSRNPIPRRNWGTISGNVAAFQSSRHARAGVTTGERHGEGWAGLLTATYTPNTRRQGQGFEAVRSYTLQFGKGSSDDPSTPDTREDYVGEGGTFTADTLLMAVFLGKINSKGHVLVGPSLANKTYIGLQIVDNTRSLLGFVASALDVGDDVISRSSTLRLRQFRFNRPIFADTDDKAAVREISLDFSIEVPKGVRWSVGGGYMSTGKGLEPVIVDDAWTVTTAVSLTL